MSLVAVDRASSASQLSTRTSKRYASRKVTVGDHAGRGSGCGRGPRLVAKALIRRRDRVLGTHKQDRPPFDRGKLPRAGVHWVQPRLVAEVGFSEWTTDGQLRHPRFQGLRDDKDPADVVREMPQDTTR